MNNLSDAELKVKLKAIGDNTPITISTRPVLIKKLMRVTRSQKPVVNSSASRRSTRHSFQVQTPDDDQYSQEEEDFEEEEVSVGNSSVSSFLNKGHKMKPSLTPSRTSTPTSLFSASTRFNGSESESRRNSSKNNTPSSSKLFPAMNASPRPSLHKQVYEDYDSASDSAEPYSSRKFARARRTLGNRSNNGSLFSNDFSNFQNSSFEDSAMDGSVNSSNYQPRDHYTRNGRYTVSSGGLFNNLFSSKTKPYSSLNLRPSFISRQWKNLKNLSSEYLNFGIPAILLILLLSFLAFVGVTYIRMLDSENFPMINPGSSILGKNLKAGDLQFPICSEDPNQNVGVCLSHDEISLARQVLPAGAKLTQDILHRSDEYQCGFHKLNYHTKEELIEKLKLYTHINDANISTAVSSIAKLATVNPSLQIEPIYDEAEPNDLIGLRTRKPRLKLACAFMNAVYVFLYVVALCGLGLVVFYAVLSIVRKWQKKKASYRQKMLNTATKAINVIQSVDEIPVDHVRDQLFSIQDRISSSKLWSDVVDFIEQHESRVVKEIGTVGGEDCEIWRWNSHKTSKKNESFAEEREKTTSLYPSLPIVDDTECPLVGGEVDSDWQGNALSQTDRVNAPTRYLKIRNLPTDIHSASHVKKALISKCEGLPMLHIVVDDTSSEGVVYLKTDTVRTAGKIYSLLHGTWFSGQLLRVKFLRDERYKLRFPASIDCTEPLTVDGYDMDEYLD